MKLAQGSGKERAGSPQKVFSKETHYVPLLTFKLNLPKPERGWYLKSMLLISCCMCTYCMHVPIVCIHVYLSSTTKL